MKLSTCKTIKMVEPIIVQAVVGVILQGYRLLLDFFIREKAKRLLNLCLISSRHCSDSYQILQVKSLQDRYLQTEVEYND